MITKQDREVYKYWTDEGILGHKLIGGLTDDALHLAKKGKGPQFKAILTLMGPMTNESWIVARVAEELYERKLIDETELDILVR